MGSGPSSVSGRVRWACRRRAAAAAPTQVCQELLSPGLSRSDSPSTTCSTTCASGRSAEKGASMAHQEAAASTSRPWSGSPPAFSADYRFGPFNIMVPGRGLAWPAGGAAGRVSVPPPVVITMVGVALVMGVLLRLTQSGRRLVVLTTIAEAPGLPPPPAGKRDSGRAVVVAGLLARRIQVAYQWEKAVLLRFGRFRGLRGRACSCSSRWSTRCRTTSTSASG